MPGEIDFALQPNKIAFLKKTITFRFDEFQDAIMCHNLYWISKFEELLHHLRNR